MKNVVLGVLCVWTLALGGCGGAEVGEACDTTGSRDECVDGAICDTEGEQVLCLLICNVDPDCPAKHKCTGVSGANIKACHKE